MTGRWRPESRWRDVDGCIFSTAMSACMATDGSRRQRQTPTPNTDNRRRTAPKLPSSNPQLRRFICNESVPIQLAQCRFPGLALSSAQMLICIFQIKYTEAILSNSTRKVLWSEINKMLIGFKIRNLLATYCNFRHTFVAYMPWAKHRRIDVLVDQLHLNISTQVMKQLHNKFIVS